MTSKTGKADVSKRYEALLDWICRDIAFPFDVCFPNFPPECLLDLVAKNIEIAGEKNTAENVEAWLDAIAVEVSMGFPRDGVVFEARRIIGR